MMDLYGRFLGRMLFPAFEAMRNRPTVPLLRQRTVLLLATEAQLPDLDAALAMGSGLRRVTVAEATTGFRRELMA